MKKLLTNIVVMFMVLTTCATANRLDVNSYSVTSGEGLLLPVDLVNDSELSAFQCDVYLPEGVVLLQNDEGVFDVRLNSDRVTSSHSIMATAQPDGAVRIAVYSSSNKAFKRNEGTLFSLNLLTDVETEGRKVIHLRNIIFSTSTAVGVTMRDVSSIVTLTKYVPKNELVMPCVSVTSGESLQIPVLLDNETELSAFQCDVYLPEGMALDLDSDGEFDVKLNPERTTSSHKIMTSMLSDGAVRIAVYSTSNKTFKGNNGELFYLNLTTDAETEGEKNISLKKVIFSTANAEKVLLEEVTAKILMVKYQPRNCFIVRDTIVTAGSSFLLPVVLTNESELSAFQCDVYLSKGLTLLVTEDGDSDVRLDEERATSSHVIMAYAQNNGSIRVVSYANPTKNFSGNNGALFYLNLQSNKDMDGEMMIEIKDIIFSTVDASTIILTDVTEVVHVQELPQSVSYIPLDKVQTVYYSVMGVPSDTPRKGLNVVKYTHENGQVVVRKRYYQ